MTTPMNERSFCRESDGAADEPIAIVGMGLRLPGNVRTADEFWDMLVSGKSGHGPVPKSRYNAKSFFHPSTAPVTGYFLEEDPAYFDAGFFSVGAKEARLMDPQQRLLLEVVWECLEDSGETSWRGKDIGCYVGVFGEDWLELSLKGLDPCADRHHALATGGFALSNRVSYEFDFRGPSMTIQTGCSASLVGLHEACQGLRSGQCSSAIVAGTNLILTPTMTSVMNQNGVLSPSGQCQTFDANADGYGRGEAINAVYLKRLSDALRDGDCVRAVIRSTAVNFDGRTAVMTNPSGIAQETLIRTAYKQAQIHNICDTGFFECHGTGTSAGDSVETSVVAKLFEGHGVLMGSVKPNCGHSEGASGLTSIIKATLALQHRTIPPNINFHEPNATVHKEGSRIEVPVKAQPWPNDRQERVSINSFGIAGANAHAILDSATAFGEQKMLHPESDRPHLVVVSAHNKVSLQRRIEDIAGYITTNPTSVRDLAYTLASRREHHSHRAFAVVYPDTPVDQSQFHSSPKTLPSPTLTFVFTGQGAQWAGMGRQLLETEPLFYNAIKKMDDVLRNLAEPPEWSLLEELSRVGTESRVNEVELAQPLCTALQVGLLQILAHWGIQPSTVIGHSSGEIAAACASGAITIESAIIIAFYRGRLARSQEGSGAMASIGLSHEEVLPFLVDGVVVACENSPRNVTISGPKEQIPQVISNITAALPGTFCRKLRVQVAYHSPQMEIIGTSYEKALVPHMNPGPHMRPMISTVTGDIITDPSQLGPSYWRRNLESPVRFSKAVEMLLQKETGVSQLFIEVGPHSALSAPLRQIFQITPRSPPVYIPTLTRNDDHQQSLLLATAGQVFNTGSFISFPTIVEVGRLLSDIPRFPWMHTDMYWSEGRPSRDWRLRSLPHHELLGSMVMEATIQEPSWRNVLRLDDVPWLSDHVLHGDVVFPAAGYIAMASEAIRQLNFLNNQSESTFERYTIQNIRFESPLMLASDAAVEIISSLKPTELADGVNSGWYNFTVCAFDGAKWTVHCKGCVRAGSDYPMPADRREVSPFPRVVEPSQWYRTVQRCGLQYGPHFQRLQDITADPIGNAAAATVHQPETQKGTHYPLHPAVIDQALQLIGIAASRGRLNTISGAFIPAKIERLVVDNGPWSRVSFEARTFEDKEKGQQAKIIGTTEGQTIFRLAGGVLAGLAGSSKAGTDDTDLVSRIHWKPDIDLLPPEKILPPRPTIGHAIHRRILGLVSLIHIRATAERIEYIDSSTEHLLKWKSWILSEAGKIRAGVHPNLQPLSSWIEEVQPETQDVLLHAVKEVLVPSSAILSDGLSTTHEGSGQWIYMPPGDVLEKIYSHLKSIPADLPGLTTIECMRAVYENAVDFMSGKCSPLEVLVASNRLERFYEDSLSRETDLTEAEMALSSLRSPTGAQLFSRYVFTDISAGFFATAQEKFKGQTNMEYRTLDITRDPTEQGFESHSFDLIIASNVMHVAPNLHQALLHTNKLLAKNGRFLLQKRILDTPVTDYVVGALPGWWLGENDGRPHKPYISGEEWDKKLRAAGFTGGETIERDLEGSVQPLFTIISRLAQEQRSDKEVTILASNLEQAGWPGDVAACFRRSGYEVHWSTLDGSPCNSRTIVSLLEVDSPYFTQSSQDQFLTLQRFLMQCKGCRLLWVTQPSTLSCTDPRFSIIHGLARVLRRELSLDLSLLEMDSVGKSAPETLVELHEKIQQAREIPDTDLEYEFILHGGVVHTAQSYRTSLSHQLTRQPPMDTPRKLGIQQAGLTSTLQWVPSTTATDLSSGEVEVDVSYVGLNFKDTLVAMGLIGNPNDMGLEATGVVRRVAPDVTDLTPGDRVGALGTGLFCNRTVLRREAVSKLPDSLALGDGAAMLTVYCTVIYSLMQVGNLQKGQSVLIHSAAGGVGIAAINICEMLGATIYATVGNEEKADYLVKTHGIPRGQIFQSRNTSFLPDIMRATNGRGVDIVLNSLSGELLHASWECVAAYGKMIEIGRRDILSHGMLSLSPFAEDRSFHAVNLANVSRDRPEIAISMVRTCFELFQKGRFRSIRPLHVFDTTQVKDAFRYLQTGKHMGKVVVQMTPDPAQLPSAPVKSRASFPANAAYLIVGGLGGIGKSVSRWLVEHGAREIVYLSPSAEKDEHRKFIEELEVQGCRVSCAAGTVTDPDDVQQAIRKCTNRLTGVVQMALNLQDRTFEHMTSEEWDSGLAPKVTGTWNLHTATQDMNLSFFVMFGSIAGSAGSLGQANYAASNTFLTGLATYRRQRGLAASVLNLGPVEDVGIISERADLAQTTSVASAQPITERAVLDSFQVSIDDSRPNQQCLGVLDVGISDKAGKSESASLMRLWGRDARFAMHSNLGQASMDEGMDGPEHRLREFLNNVHQDPSLLNNTEAITEFKRNMAHLIAGTISNGQKLTDEEAAGFAIDSLVAIEMRSWVRRAIHLDVPLSEITQAGNLGSLADHIVKLLRVQYKLGSIGE
ncbi:type I polyketide synthase [Aspergillus vadensis CBS 113365]|uniref:Polyketide synthase n=1 Tax=Aspergillus vadensis (strain CBS 113365 / IMI 142717 / IBT 24658) TaxID=1448311 RepID=A0A319B6J7_ASPVC|nr:polyketide synthase [Aspergillus vadensis CBS 113365]PYH65910.1 polyketide synthase [Aspergillus vadensis CBS 113365]